MQAQIMLQKTGKSWMASVVGMLPFVFWPLGILITLVVNELAALSPALLAGAVHAGPLLGGLFFLFCVLLLTVIVAVGGVLDWPDWVFPNACVLLVISTLVQLLVSSNTMINDIPIRNGLVWGWLAWLPEILVMLVWVVLRPKQSFSSLGRALRLDWTRMSFGLYGLVPVALVVAYDDVRVSLLVSAILFLFIAGGALGYIRTPQVPWRIIWLALAFWVTWALAAVILFFNWRGRQEIWMDAPSTGWPELLRFLSAGGQILLALCLPGIVVGLSRLFRRFSRPEI